MGESVSGLNLNWEMVSVRRLKRNWHEGGAVGPEDGWVPVASGETGVGAGGWMGGGWVGGGARFGHLWASILPGHILPPTSRDFFVLLRIAPRQAYHLGNSGNVV